MARHNVSVKLYPMKIAKLSRASIAALEKTAEELRTEVTQAQVMPFETGNLQNESTFVDHSESNRGKAYIVHDTPYARRLYYHPEYKFSKKENPHAKGRWWEDWLKGGNKAGRPTAIFKKFFKREAGL